MGYCMSMLAASDRVVPAGELRALLDDCQTGVTLTCTCGTEDDWVQLQLQHRESPTDDPDEVNVAFVERYPFAGPAEALNKVENLLGVADGEPQPPATAAAWVLRQAGSVRVEYLFRIHTVLSEDENGAVAVEQVLSRLHVELGGLSYAEQQGFFLTAEDADWQITWHPAMNASRPGTLRRMAVLDGASWVLFIMDAGDPAHRAAFRRGEVPPGIVPVARRA